MLRYRNGKKVSLREVMSVLKWFRSGKSGDDRLAKKRGKFGVKMCV